MALRLQTNVPVAARLLSHGETAPSSYGPDQVKYRTDQGDLYVSEVVGALLNQMITRDNIAIGEAVVIAKREIANGNGRKSIRWSIERAAAVSAVTPGNGTLAVPIDPPSEIETQLRASIAHVEVRKPAATAPAAVSEFASRLARETNAIVDAFAMALQHANANYGAAVKADDVRSILLSAYINASRNGARNAA